MKKVIGIMIVFVAFLLSSNSFASENVNMESHKEDWVVKVTVVGYRESDREKIFGDKSEEEILKILREENDKLSKMENVNSFNKATTSYDLFYSVHYYPNDNTQETYLKKDLTENYITPFSPDEIPISNSFTYDIQLELNSGNNKYGVFRSNVRGLYSKVTNKSIIDSLNTYFLTGDRFYFTDYVSEFYSAFTHFYSPNPSVNWFHNVFFEARPGGNIVMWP